MVEGKVLASLDVWTLVHTPYGLLSPRTVDLQMEVQRQDIGKAPGDTRTMRAAEEAVSQLHISLHTEKQRN